MTTSTSNKPSRLFGVRYVGRSGETGATLIEMLVAMVILMFGLLGLVATLGWSLNTSKRLRNMTDSKLTISSILEQMENLRNTKRLTFGQIANAGSVNNVGAQQTFGGFETGFQPVSISPGPDGIYGTSDDLRDDGADNIYGTGDDFTNQALARPRYTREIVITSLSSNLKKIQVTIRYPGRDGDLRDLVGVSYLNNDAASNFR